MPGDPGRSHGSFGAVLPRSAAERRAAPRVRPPLWQAATTLRSLADQRDRSHRQRRPLTVRFCGTPGNFRFWPILLKNSISLEDEKLRALLERQARFELRGYEEKLMSQRGASEWPTSGTGCYFLVRFPLDENLLSSRFRVFQQDRPTAAVPCVRRERVLEDSGSCRERPLTG